MPDDHSLPLRGPIGWGDALAAAHQLDLAATWQFDALVDFLGLSAPQPETPPDVVDSVSWRPTDRPAPPTTPSMPSLRDDELRIPRDHRTIAEELHDQPVELIEFDGEPPLEPTVAVRPLVPYEPPIPANQLRAALTMLVRRARISDNVDVEAAIALLAEQRPFVELPRQLEQSTVQGATVVADMGPSMLPYLDDVARLVAEIGQVVGESQLTVQWLEEDASHDDRVPPMEGGPVIVISTLGAVRPPSERPGAQERWNAFADTAWEAGADVIPLVPYRGRRWPRNLVRAMRFVAWDDLADVGRGHG